MDLNSWLDNILKNFVINMDIVSKANIEYDFQHALHFLYRFENPEALIIAPIKNIYIF